MSLSAEAIAIALTRRARSVQNPAPPGWKDRIASLPEVIEALAQDGMLSERDLARAAASEVWPEGNWPPPRGAFGWQHEAWEAVNAALPVTVEQIQAELDVRRVGQDLRGQRREGTGDDGGPWGPTAGPGGVVVVGIAIAAIALALALGKR